MNDPYARNAAEGRLCTAGPCRERAERCSANSPRHPQRGRCVSRLGRPGATDMPKRTDIESDPDHRRRPDHHRPGVRVRLFGRAGVQGAARGGLSRDPRQLESGDDHDRPGDGRRDVHRADHLADGRRRSSRRERPDALLPTMGGQTALNCALDLAREGILTKFDVELIGASKKAIDKAGGPRKVQGGDDADRPRLGALGHRAQPRAGARSAGGHRLPGRHPAVVHAGRHRRRHRLQQGRVRRDVQARPRPLADARAADRGVAARLERVRDGGRARPRRTTASSSARSRTSIRWACTPATRSPSRRRRRSTDKEYQIMRDAVDRGAARGRRRHRRLERPVRDQPGRRAHDRHRDEPARVALARRSRRRPPAFRSPRSRPSSPSATRSTN